MHVQDAKADAGPSEAAAALERLRSEHREIDALVMKLEHKGYLTSEEDSELKRLKRLKLSKKDQMYLLGRRLGIAV